MPLKSLEMEEEMKRKEVRNLIMNFVCNTLRTARATRVQNSFLQLAEASIY